jgi:hypothetical protein
MVEHRFSLDAMVAAYGDLYLNMLDQTAGRPAPAAASGR